MTSCSLGCFENKVQMRNEFITLPGLKGACLWHRDVPRSPNMSFPKGLLLWKDLKVLSASDAETMEHLFHASDCPAFPCTRGLSAHSPHPIPCMMRCSSDQKRETAQLILFRASRPRTCPPITKANRDWLLAISSSALFEDKQRSRARLAQ